MLLTDTPRNPLPRPGTQPIRRSIESSNSRHAPAIDWQSIPHPAPRHHSSSFQRISAPYIATAAAICSHGGQGTSRPSTCEVLPVTTLTASCGLRNGYRTDSAQGPYTAARGSVPTAALFPATSSRLIGQGVTCWLKFGRLDLPAMHRLASLSARSGHWDIGDCRPSPDTAFGRSSRHPWHQGSFKSLGNAGCPSNIANVGWRSQTGGLP